MGGFINAFKTRKHTNTFTQFIVFLIFLFVFNKKNFLWEMRGKEQDPTENANQALFDRKYLFYA